MFHPIDNNGRKLSIAIGIGVFKVQIVRGCNFKIVTMKFQKNEASDQGATIKCNTDEETNFIQINNILSHY